MKEYSTKDIRNVVLIGSAKSGKTTLSEAMLFEGKVIARRGTVEDKNTVSDNEEIEKLNQRSIFATPLYAEFMNTKFNVIDAPGSDDFIGGAVSAFKVCENGILVINAQQVSRWAQTSSRATPTSTSCLSSWLSTSLTPRRPTGRRLSPR